jgi:hypothetical protein
MKNDTPLRWKLKLTVDLAPGESVEHDVTEWTRGERVDLASLGLSMEEGKTILAEIQTQKVAVQVERDGDAHRCCGTCGQKLRNKGHYQSTFRSVYGNVPVQIRRVKACRGCGENPVAPLFTRKSSTARKCQNWRHVGKDRSTLSWSRAQNLRSFNGLRTAATRKLSNICA